MVNVRGVALVVAGGGAMTIIVVKRSHDYMAHAANNMHIWECGATQAEAVGKLLITLSRQLGVTVVWLPAE